MSRGLLDRTPGAGLTSAQADGLYADTASLPFASYEDYGAVGNAQILADGAITTGTPNLTSASASWSSNDVGKSIIVVGAGAAGAALRTTILARVSATAVTLAANAGTTVSGAQTTYGTDDTAAFAALHAAAPVGVLRMDRRYLIMGNLTPGSGAIVGPYMQLSATAVLARTAIVFGGTGTMLAPVSASFSTDGVVFIDAAGRDGGNTNVMIAPAADYRGFRTHFRGCPTAVKLGASSFYSRLDFCEWQACNIGIDAQSGVTDLHITGPRSGATNTFLKIASGVRPITIIGGSIEGFTSQGGIWFAGTNIQLSILGTYWESTSGSGNIGINGASSSSVTLVGNYVLLDKLSRWFTFSGQTAVTLVSHSNRFAQNSGDTTAAIACYLPTSGSVQMGPDDWSTVAGTNANYYSSAATLPVSGFNVNPPFTTNNLGTYQQFGRTGDFLGSGTTAPSIRVRQNIHHARVTQTLASNGAVTINAALGKTQNVVLGANATSSTITNPQTGMELTIQWQQDATGTRTYVWPTNVRFAANTAPVASITASTIDSVTFVYDGALWVERGRAVAVPAA